jgi:hypothetical protein
MPKREDTSASEKLVRFDAVERRHYPEAFGLLAHYAPHEPIYGSV